MLSSPASAFTIIKVSYSKTQWADYCSFLTGTRLDTGGSKAELLVWVGFGLKGDRVIDGGRRAVLLAHTAVVEVTASLERRGRRKLLLKWPRMFRQNNKEDNADERKSNK